MKVTIVVDENTIMNERDLSSVRRRDTRISSLGKLSNALAEPLNGMYKSPLVRRRSVNGCVYAYILLTTGIYYHL